MGEVQGGDGNGNTGNAAGMSGASEAGMTQFVAPQQPVRASSTRALVLGWCQQLPAGGQTSVTPRVRRSSGLLGPVIGGANAEGTEGGGVNAMPVFIMVVDNTVVQDTTQYTASLQQAGAGGGSTFSQASQAVFLVG